MQAGGRQGLSKFGKLVPPSGAGGSGLQQMLPKVASLYKGVVGAASGAGNSKPQIFERGIEEERVTEGGRCLVVGGG